ncbi:Glu/Leu/Phe/Val dehydrogenase dimerization domain-containing protein [Paraburkholderia sp. J7]|uniref:Glu/Leu/Phe/Val dehydrogenase dimerization domain-containing protein n=1 Tax=Paraburkholderia sp. J7 TaxID=2805438 RepID=UPI002AB79EB2|nr:Glu/Leu/Phe/Val dehydrogenase dimerization domain-containing protein [Paraburkholderia sp. J7]
MAELFIPTDHELFQIKPGYRTGLPVMIGVHSTVLGPAVGGLRIKHYDDSATAISDVLRLSQAMTVKAAAIDNGTGGGKTVVPLPSGFTLTPQIKEAILLDVADQVHSLDGTYHVAPDVGTGPADIDIIRRRTPFAGGYSKEAGGAGGTTFGTYVGVDTAIRATVGSVLQKTSMKGLRVSIVGLGGIGTLLAKDYAKEGAILTVADIDESRKALAEEIGAKWVTPEEAMLESCDVLAPCALGGVLTHEIVPQLSAHIICGAANNQLTNEDIADALLARDIVYVPDFIANAGGVMYATGIELHHRTEQGSEKHTRDGIKRNVELVLDVSKTDKISTHVAAVDLALTRLKAASSHVSQR